MIVGIDTIRSDDGGHRGTGGEGGEEQGWIVGEGEYLSKYETLCTVADMAVYVCARDGMHVRYISTTVSKYHLPCLQLRCQPPSPGAGSR